MGVWYYRTIVFRYLWVIGFTCISRSLDINRLMYIGENPRTVLALRTAIRNASMRFVETFCFHFCAIVIQRGCLGRGRRSREKREKWVWERVCQGCVRARQGCNHKR